MSEQSDIQLNSGDMSINIKGKSEIFNGVDLQLKAARNIIESMDFKFAVDTDYEYSQKAFLQLVDSLGSLMRSEGVYPSELSNIEVVQSFLNWSIDDEKLHEKTEYVELLKDKGEEY